MPPTLTADDIRLVPLSMDVVDDMHALGGDPETLRFTYVSAPFTREDATAWVRRYVDGWDDGSCAGFHIRDVDSGAFLGFVAIVHIENEARQGEIGYIVAPGARGRGVATRALGRITEWALGERGLERVELRIGDENAGSIAVAERAGFRYEGTMRSLYFKDGLRSDTRVYARIPSDAKPEAPSPA
jgi:RimJ/RimL family protein N-acetyltransferase